MYRKMFVCLSSFMLVVCFVISAQGHGDGSTLLEDVNNDGKVNIQDLVLVANAFGQPGDRTSTTNPDVNRDGMVDILDLVRVANRFGETEQGDNSTYHEIQDNIFDKSCVNSACHAPPGNAANLNLSYGQSYQDLVNRIPRNSAAAAAGMKLIDPENPENSFLLTKLMNIENQEFGQRMPYGVGPIHNGKIDALRTWISCGGTS